MDRPDDAVTAFYLDNVDGEWQENGFYVGVCPFCKENGRNKAGKLAILLNRESFFHGYFRCLSKCVPGGFPYWFASLAECDQTTVPGYNPDRDLSSQLPDYPVANINSEVLSYHDRLADHLLDFFSEREITPRDLQEMQIGFNGRYITYPYTQADGNCYSIRCVHPEKVDDYFWHGDERFSRDPFHVFNVQDFERCTDGAMFLCEGEENLLVLKHLGYPGVAVPFYHNFETLAAARFENISTVFLVTKNSVESDAAARELAARIGYKVRLLRWPAGTPRGYSLVDLARDKKKKVGQAVSTMIRTSNAFSPFSSPEREYSRFIQRLTGRSDSAYTSLLSGFERLDTALEGVHGINVIGGAPKVGKSAFAIQVASQMAEKGIPVLYYDFENGRQQVYQRILSRLSRVSVSDMARNDLPEEQLKSLDNGRQRLKRMLQNFRVLNDRQVTPELMRRHIDFIRHENRSNYTTVVIDSLHKLPFKDLAERRTGIDAWLRQLESIRDEMQVSFLVISELSRGDQKAYTEEPHLGIFKGSGDIEYSADNAMVLFEPLSTADQEEEERTMTLWVVASREHSPGPVAEYKLDYPYWGFIERPMA
ncbi:DnaB-like helicase C-terminal domain-containing protein [Desulfopila sp. IMCC35008]|uniref:DnaB-like helicase C-terminal domain-containing protein n=1 Tax=Desulfopila sp. IMCC35008 TaxID=2653858 RepID=UPI0013D4AF4E|nr:DnaB-like helicase C-terminal domain-containing protein [Desulfopila sp. IMCC35008]